MSQPTPPRDPEHPWRGEEIAAPTTRREGDQPAADSVRETQPLPAQAGEVETRTTGGARPSMTTTATPGQLTPSHFINERDGEIFRQRWLHLQSGFVDQPRETVEEADQLLGEVLDRLSRGLTAERDSLAARWRAGSGEPDTESLRLAVQGYRSLLERLLGT